MSNSSGEKGEPSRPLIILERACVARPGAAILIRNLNWTLKSGQSWAIVGPTGSGKSTLAEILAGRLPLQAGHVSWPCLSTRSQTDKRGMWPTEAIHLVSFKEESWRFSYSRHYYQQRYNFIEPQDDLTLTAFLAWKTNAPDSAITRVLARVGLAGKERLSLIKLSNGQMRRARIAKALLDEPAVVIVDNPFLGLDSEGRHAVGEALQALAASGTSVVVIDRAEEIPEWISHVLELKERPWQGRRDDLTRRFQNASTLKEISGSSQVGEPIIEMANVNVAYGDTAILQNINWTVRAGQRWRVSGANGSGKSTLMSLIYADHPKAYANDIRLFGRSRGTGESIWDIKSRIGFVSPELHLYFSEPLTGQQVIATGFHDSLHYQPEDVAQRQRIQELLDYFECRGPAVQEFMHLSTGEQRLLLLLRALVKKPSLLVLDEPFQGMDWPHIEKARGYLDNRLDATQALVFISHVEMETPRSVSHRLHLESGRVAFQS